MKYLAIIPARGGSKGVLRKNVRDICGKPLIFYSIVAAREAGVIDRIIVSTDDDEIRKISTDLGAETILRPKELARDDTPTLVVLQHVVKVLKENNYHPEAVVTLQPTSPLRKAKHIVEATRLFEADPKADSLVSCLAVPHNFHPFSVMKLDQEGYLVPFFKFKDYQVRRQDKSAIFARNGAAIYITHSSNLAKYIFGGRCIPYYMCPEESLDIDSEEDLKIAEALMSNY